LRRKSQRKYLKRKNQRKYLKRKNQRKYLSWEVEKRFPAFQNCAFFVRFRAVKTHEKRTKNARFRVVERFVPAILTTFTRKRDQRTRQDPPRIVLISKESQDPQKNGQVKQGRRSHHKSNRKFHRFFRVNKSRTCCRQLGHKTATLRLSFWSELVFANR
jgi:hypothetical protein